jgi:hypothetical protein
MTAAKSSRYSIMIWTTSSGMNAFLAIAVRGLHSTFNKSHGSVAGASALQPEKRCNKTSRVASHEAFQFRMIVDTPSATASTSELNVAPFGSSRQMTTEK